MNGDGSYNLSLDRLWKPRLLIGMGFEEGSFYPQYVILGLHKYGGIWVGRWYEFTKCYNEKLKFPDEGFHYKLDKF